MYINDDATVVVSILSIVETDSFNKQSYTCASKACCDCRYAICELNVIVLFFPSLYEILSRTKELIKLQKERNRAYTKLIITWSFLLRTINPPQFRYKKPLRIMHIKHAGRMSSSLGQHKSMTGELQWCHCLLRPQYVYGPGINIVATVRIAGHSTTLIKEMHGRDLATATAVREIASCSVYLRLLSAFLPSVWLDFWDKSSQTVSGLPDDTRDKQPGPSYPLPLVTATTKKLPSDVTDGPLCCSCCR